MSYKTFKTACLGFALILSSCTLSPENNEPSSSIDSYLLTSITTNGILTFSRFDYDSNGRLTQIVLGDSKIEFSYQGSSSLPSKISEIEYDSNEVETYEAERITWSDMKYDGNGLLVSASYDETYGYEDYTSSYEPIIKYDTTHSIHIQEYDAYGHMIKTICRSEGESDEITTLVWEDNLLIKTYDNVEPIETTEYEYSNFVNTLAFSDPFTAVGGPINMTGIFGKNPAKFVKKITYTNGQYKEVSQFAYSFYPNGLINKMKIKEDDEEITLNFNYNIK